MKTVNDFLNFCDAAIFNDYKNIVINRELNQARKGIINNFHETILVSRMRVTLFIIDELILKINNNDIEKIIENIDD